MHENKTAALESVIFVPGTNGMRLISLHRIPIVRWRFKEAFGDSLDVITLHAFQSSAVT
jgi:hypothetical protein